MPCFRTTSSPFLSFLVSDQEKCFPVLFKLDGRL